MSGLAEIRRQACDVLIIGAGPAGLAAACRAASPGVRVVVVDDNPHPGGQIWRRQQLKAITPEANAWLSRAREARVTFITGARVFDSAPDVLMADAAEGIHEISYRRLILATGARERFLPFPGWTLPNVCGAGGLQALVKSGLPIAGKRVVIAGSGPLLMAVAAYLLRHRAEVLLIAEQAPLGRLLKFGATLLRSPAKASQAIALRYALAGVPYSTGCWPISAGGDEAVRSVTLKRGSRTWQVDCDYLACGFHLVPNLELATFIGCELKQGAVAVDQYQETSVSNVFCAGEATGIGGLELALAEGQIAGYAAAGKYIEAEKQFKERKRFCRFAEVLNNTFALRDELKELAERETIVCRCEDVNFGRLQKQESWRAAKLQTRCGMGPCQGRICGSALEFLFGWKHESVRPPLFPVRLGNLVRTTAHVEELR